MECETELQDDRVRPREDLESNHDNGRSSEQPLSLALLNPQHLGLPPSLPPLALDEPPKTEVVERPAAVEPVSKVRPLLKALWYDDETKDVTIVSSDFGRVRCHASILRMVSPFASHMLAPYDTMTSEPVWIHVPDVPCTAVVDFLKRVYCVETEGNPGTAHLEHLVKCFGIIDKEAVAEEQSGDNVSQPGVVRVTRDPKAFQTVYTEIPVKPPPPPHTVKQKRRLVQETWNGKRMVCSAPVPAVKTVQELEFMGKAFLQGHGSMHGIPRARQMILEDLANALWKHYEVAHKDDAVENQNYITDDTGGRNGGEQDPSDFMVSNLVVKSEPQYDDYGFDNDAYGGFDVKPEGYYDDDDDDDQNNEDDEDYKPPKKKKKTGGSRPFVGRSPVQAEKKCHICTQGRIYSTFAGLRTHMDDAHPDVRDFSCSICSRDFTTEFDLEKHKMYKHDKKRKYPCPHCDSAFPEPYKLNRHIRSVHGLELEHQCVECDVGFLTAVQLIRHKHRTHGEPYPEDFQDKLKEEKDAEGVKSEVFSDDEGTPIRRNTAKKEKPVFSKECHLCQRVFSNQQKLRNHVEKIHEVRDFHCGVCAMDFVTSFDLHKHKLNEHDKKRKYRCEKCPQAFTETYKLKRHIRTVHDTSRADRGLNCDECESSFAKMAHLIRHKTSIHNSKPEGSEDVKPPKEGGGSNIKISGKPQLCTECGKTFENERLLSYHQNWHKGLQPYVCEEQDCVYRSHSKIGLQKHNIQMHREKTRSRRCPKCHHEGGPNHDKLHHDPSLPYGCDETGCEYRSADANEIKRHWEMKHNPENQMDKKTQCPFCVIQIVRSGLQRHLDRHHSPNLPFECSQCGFRGISKQSIKSHEGKYHSKKERIPCSFLCGQTFTQRFSMRRHTLRECPNSTTRDEIREAEKLSGKFNERLQKNRQKAQEYMERASKFIKMSSTF